MNELGINLTKVGTDMYAVSMGLVSNDQLINCDAQGTHKLPEGLSLENVASEALTRFGLEGSGTVVFVEGQRYKTGAQIEQEARKVLEAKLYRHLMVWDMREREHNHIYISE